MKPIAAGAGILLTGLLFLLMSSSPLFSAGASLDLTLRERLRIVKLPARTEPGQSPPGTFTLTERKAEWDPKKTALIICDMWDDHWCKSAARRVTELAGPMNESKPPAPGASLSFMRRAA